MSTSLASSNPRWASALCSGVLVLPVAFEAEAQTTAPSQGALTVTADRPKTPWKRRAREGVIVLSPRGERPPDYVIPKGALSPRELRRLGLRPRGRGLIDVGLWPKEPSTPESLEAKRFAHALGKLCPPWTSSKDVGHFASWSIEYGRQFGVDPFLLAALAYQLGECDAHRRSSFGVGLTSINPGMYAGGIERGAYRYWIRGRRSWRKRALSIDRFAFERAELLRPEASLYFAAAFLGVYERQCPDIDRPFRSAPHRHPVSHFIWGDRVRGSGAEDLVLLARRRLVQYYGAAAPPPKARFRSIALSSPLDGPPRIVTSAWGDERDNGGRMHKGIDILSTHAEPVRAVVPGFFVVVGADWRNRETIKLSPRTAATIPPSRLGPRGLLVKVEHSAKVRTLYAHLSTYTVRKGQTVKRGQLIGYVGRSGMRNSDAHLHLGLLVDDAPVDPLPHLAPYVFRMEMTQQGGRLAAKRRRQAKASHRTQPGGAPKAHSRASTAKTP